MICRAAVITPPGAAGVAVVQIVGPGGIDVLGRIFRPVRGQSIEVLGAGRLLLGTIYDEQDRIDQVMVAADSAGSTVDINCHGGGRIIQRLLLLLKKQGVEIVCWQELRPVDAIAAEVSATLAGAKTHMGVMAIAAQYPQGLFDWVKRMIESCQVKTACLDSAIDTLHGDIDSLRASYPLAQKLLNPPSVVLAGPANTGKSTLANALAGHPQSITADMPGTTRDWTEQLLDIRGIPVVLIDTAGERPTVDSLEQQAQEQARLKMAQADLVVLVAAADDSEGLETYSGGSKNPQCRTCEAKGKLRPLLVVNKIDLATEDQKTAWVTKSANQTAWATMLPPLLCSAKTGDGLDELRTEIAKRLGFADFDPVGPLVFTERQYNLLGEIRQSKDIGAIGEKLKELLGSETV